MSKKMAGVEMRLIAGGIRELHWHVGAEWALMLYGSARITAVDQEGRSFVSDVNEGDLWIFPGGIPHSIQGLGPDGARFLLVFDDGNFNEFETFLLTDWIAHTPPEVLAKNFDAAENPFTKSPKKELFIFSRDLPRPLAEEQKAGLTRSTGKVPNTLRLQAPSKMEPTKVRRRGGEREGRRPQQYWPATDIAAAIVTVKPGGLRELHWHPNEPQVCYHPQLGPDPDLRHLHGGGGWRAGARLRHGGSDGMKVETSRRARATAQREAFDRILGNHLLYCTVCDNNNGNCTVHNTTKLLAIEHQRDTPSSRSRTKVDNSNPFLPLRSQPVHSVRPLRGGLPESAGERDAVHPLGGSASARAVGWRRADRRIELRLLRPLRHGLPVQRAHGEIHAGHAGF
jgi:oxalate decarboxylase/phosphoglucose isomerase-like protein (cupin superfamily)